MRYHDGTMRDHAQDTTFGELVATELDGDNEFRAEWLRLAPARQFAVMLIEYRSDHGLTQRQLAGTLGVSQSRVAKLESGERNPDFDTIVATVEKLGTEYCVDVGPAAYEPKLVTKGTRTSGQVVRHGNVAVVTASAARG